jgi:hypothetical protein
LIQNCCLVVITESWLTDNYSDSQIALENYNVFRADREGIKSSKTKGGGLALYVHKDWCAGVKIINRYHSPFLETMAVSLRPYWTPRDVSTITLLIIYATVFETTPATVARATTDTIHKQIDELETAYPDSTTIALGDLNHINIKLPNYVQQISCSTRGNNTLDKCYLKIKDAFKCYKLPKLGNSDHHPILLIPKASQKNSSEAAPSTSYMRDWCSSNTDKLICELENTDWNLLASQHQSNINKQAELITDYISYTFESCIPMIEKKIKPDKAWMNRKIRKLLTEWHYVLANKQYDRIPTGLLLE